MGFNLGREIRSAIQTYDATDQIFRNAENDRRQRERDKREEERYALEKKRTEREEAAAQRDESLRQRFEELEKARQTGSGPFAELPKNEQVAPPAGQLGQPAAPGQPPAQPGQPQPRLGAAPQQPQPKDPLSQFLDPTPERMYANPAQADQLYYSQLASLMRESYANKGDYARAAMVDSEVKKLMESGYDKVRKSAVAAVVAGADGKALEPLLQKAYATLDDGREIKPGSVQYDPKSGKYSMTIVGPDGKGVNQSFDKMGLAGVLMVADPLKVLEWNTGRADKEREFKLDERRTRAAETTAGAAVLKARADQNTSDALLKGADIKARQETLSALFPMANVQPKTEDMLGKSPKEIQTIQQQIATDRKLMSGAERILGLNPRLDPRTAAEIVRNGAAYPILGTEGGLTYTVVAGQKVYVP